MKEEINMQEINSVKVLESCFSLPVGAILTRNEDDLFEYTDTNNVSTDKYTNIYDINIRLGEDIIANMLSNKTVEVYEEPIEPMTLEEIENLRQYYIDQFEKVQKGSDYKIGDETVLSVGNRAEALTVYQNLIWLLDRVLGNKK